MIGDVPVTMRISISCIYPEIIFIMKLTIIELICFFCKSSLHLLVRCFTDARIKCEEQQYCYKNDDSNDNYDQQDFPRDFQGFHLAASFVFVHAGIVFLISVRFLQTEFKHRFFW